MESSPNPFDAAFEAEARALQHEVTIVTRYGETIRECYCTATQDSEDGRSHHEYDFPWIPSVGGEPSYR